MSTAGFGHFKQMIGAVSSRAIDSLSLGERLSGLPVPENMLVRPVDCWAGNAEHGQQICFGSFCLGDDELHLQKHCWAPFGISQKWLNMLHGFNWLRDLRSYGSEEARVTVRALIAHWIQENRDTNALPWRSDLCGGRLAMWIAHFDFFSAGAHDDFYDSFFASLTRQARHLHVNVHKSAPGLPRLLALRGLLYAGLALEGREAYVHKALDLLEGEVKAQILPDGAHISRSPASLLGALMCLLDIRMALMAGGLPAQEPFQHAIDKMGMALRFFVYGDKHLAVFQGSQEGDREHIASALSQADVKGKILTALPSAFYERVAQGRSLLLFDAGGSPPPSYDKSSHSAPLSFEFAYGKDRIFVNCGTHPASTEWAESLRSTAAHNTLSIGNVNACEIRKDGGFGRKVKAPFVKRQETKQFTLIESSHDGYLSLNGFTHERRLFLCEGGHDLRGEDTLVSMFEQPQNHDFAIRFHLHPRVLVSLIRDGQEALLRLSNGVGWRFFHEAGRLALEDSIYIGAGSHPRKTKQLVIYGQTRQKHTQTKWALQREGL